MKQLRSNYWRGDDCSRLPDATKDGIPNVIDSTVIHSQIVPSLITFYPLSILHTHRILTS